MKEFEMNIEQVNDNFGIDLDEFKTIKNVVLYRIVALTNIITSFRPDIQSGYRGGWLSKNAIVNDDDIWIGNGCHIFNGIFLGGTFYGGQFHGGIYFDGTYFGGKFYDGRFHDGIFWDGVFWGGEFHNGIFRDQVYHAGKTYGYPTI